MKCRLFPCLWVACLSAGLALPKSAVHAASIPSELTDRSLPSILLTQAPKKSTGLPRWVLGALGLTAMTTVGGSVLLVRRHLSLATSTPGPDPAFLPQPSDRPSPDPQPAQHLLLTSPIAPEATHPSKPAAPPSSALTTSSASPEVTRLAKLNVVEELIHELRQTDPSKRHKAIWELGQQGDTRAVQPLVDLMARSDSRQRNLILSALSEIGSRTLKPMSRALALSLQDESADVRRNAIRDLSRMYDLVAQVSQLLHAAAEDPDTEVSETARWAIGQLHRIKTPLIEPATFSSSPIPPARSRESHSSESP